MNRVDNLVSQLQDNYYVRVERRGIVGLIRLLRSAPPRSQVGGCVLCAPMRAQILRALRLLEADPGCLVIVLCSTSDRYFSSGIDISDFAEGLISRMDQQPPMPSLSQLNAAIEASPKVCVAAIQGLCSSWGLELALACDYRVCTISSQFRFPEVLFGITPCGGGANRLVCRVGIPHAIEMLCSGRVVYPREARAFGLIDVSACEVPQLWEALREFIRTHVAVSNKDGLRNLEDAYAAKALARQRRRACPAFAGLPFYNRGWYAWTAHKLREIVPRGQKAAYHALDAVNLAVTHSLKRSNSLLAAVGVMDASASSGGNADNAKAILEDADYAAAERKLFEMCLKSPEALASQHLLRASQRTSMSWEKMSSTPAASVEIPVTAKVAIRRVVPSIPIEPGTTAVPAVSAGEAGEADQLPQLGSPAYEGALQASQGLKQVAVLGASTMGTSVVLLLLWHRDFEQVFLIETDVLRQQQAVKAIAEHLNTRVAENRLSSYRRADMLGRLRVAGSHIDPFPRMLAEVDVVLECATEMSEIKKNIFAHLDRICKRSTILGTVSPAEDVDALAMVTRRPGQVVGLHFFPPANHSRLVEVICGAETERWVIERVMHLLHRLDKYPIVSRNRHGYVATRLFLVALYQAYAMLEDGCFPLQIDLALKRVFHFKRGIFEMEDIMGLDVMAGARATMLRKGPNGSLRTSIAATAALTPNLPPSKEIPISVPSSEEISNEWWLPSRQVYDIPNSMIAVGALGRKAREGWYKYVTPEELTFKYAVCHPIASWLWLPSSPAMPPASAAITNLNKDSFVGSVNVVTGVPIDPVGETDATSPPAATDALVAEGGEKNEQQQQQQHPSREPLLSLEALVPQHNYSVEYRTLDSSKRHHCTRRPFRDAEIVERIVFAMVNEAAKMMADNVIQNSSDIDCISVFGFGFPAWKGGLCYYADRVAGLEKVVYKMKVYQRALGSEEFPFPCVALQEMLTKGQTFASISV